MTGSTTHKWPSTLALVDVTTVACSVELVTFRYVLVPVFLRRTYSVFFTGSSDHACVFQVELYGWPFAAAPLLLELAVSCLPVKTLVRCLVAVAGGSAQPW